MSQAQEAQAPEIPKTAKSQPKQRRVEFSLADFETDASYLARTKNSAIDLEEEDQELRKYIDEGDEEDYGDDDEYDQDFYDDYDSYGADKRGPNASGSSGGNSGGGGGGGGSTNEESRGMSKNVETSLNRQHRKTDTVKPRTIEKDKADRATTELVLDPRTRLMLFKLKNKGVFTEMHGCISTGKEANVYHADSDQGELAMKIYKTSILVFKDRDKYVTGEFSFRRGYCKSNPRKMVKLWAEKEMRNLLRIKKAGIKCPMPILLRAQVLIMTFLGEDSHPAPKLKDANVSQEKMGELYEETIRMMRTLYQECHLVHADLSEYNILYHEGSIWVIDVSQAVEHDHPHSLSFLRMDCMNVTRFFRKRNVNTMALRELFDFVTDPRITNVDEFLSETIDRLNETCNLSDQQRAELQVDEDVFMNSYIPRTLHDLIDAERDINKFNAGETDTLLYQTLTGIGADGLPEAEAKKAIEKKDGDEDGDENDESDDDEDDDEDEDSDEDEDEEGEDGEPRKKGKKSKGGDDEPVLSKKERKKLAKEEQREKRKTKVPKHIKNATKKKRKIWAEKNKGKPKKAGDGDRGKKGDVKEVLKVV
eukprot:TRINITY_DN616_c0_g3_i1.p1 TRINITY_DN616_c0_g3~~TRINITY_DN616_c0_g3_i1.p1  ORF type:complete len:592 (-),score=274.69 TRINITY_DN616_c0_g3_i1:116-1891(-)